ncbi:MAG TPA: formate dehydrogenase subunit delta [Xanthobacteraceae bacterium]|jgi:formate dehydrogenase subunit delta|nr:formate dehydrogenase subunit delta [Xanthobacteraceae bacterium]
MSPDKLAYMANQIGKFFASQGFDRSVASIVDHLTKFWDPRMRAAILAHLDAGGANLDPTVREAVHKLRATQQASLELTRAIPEEKAHDDGRTGQR